MYYKFHCGFYHGCNSGNLNFNRRKQHNFGLRRKAAYEPFETCRQEDGRLMWEFALRDGVMLALIYRCV